MLILAVSAIQSFTGGPLVALEGQENILLLAYMKRKFRMPTIVFKIPDRNGNVLKSEHIKNGSCTTNYQYHRI